MERTEVFFFFVLLNNMEIHVRMPDGKIQISPQADPAVCQRVYYVLFNAVRKARTDVTVDRNPRKLFFRFGDGLFGIHNGNLDTHCYTTAIRFRLSAREQRAFHEYPPLGF